MSKESAGINLTNHFLIAMPGLEDEMFGRSVVYMCEHSDKGALGLVVNKPSDIRLSKLFEKVDLPLDRPDLADQPVFHGGPVQTERGFVLHDALTAGTTSQPEPGDASGHAGEHAAETPSDGASASTHESVYASTLTIPGGLEMTTSRDVLEALSSGAGPRRVFVSLGYASWGQGQLESELAENSWLTVEARADIIFDTPVERRYDEALGLLGLQAWMISPEAGHS